MSVSTSVLWRKICQIFQKKWWARGTFWNIINLYETVPGGGYQEGIAKMIFSLKKRSLCKLISLIVKLPIMAIEQSNEKGRKFFIEILNHQKLKKWMQYLVNSSENFWANIHGVRQVIILTWWITASMRSSGYPDFPNVRWFALVKVPDELHTRRHTIQSGL